MKRNDGLLEQGGFCIDGWKYEISDVVACVVSCEDRVNRNRGSKSECPSRVVVSFRRYLIFYD